MEGFEGWCDAYHLLINVKKTEQVIIDPRSVGDTSSVVIHGQEIKQVASYKYLGIHIDSELKWHTHFKCLFKSLSAITFLKKTKIIQYQYQYYAIFL